MVTKKTPSTVATSPVTSDISFPWGSWLRISLALFVIIGAYSLGVKMGEEKGVATFGTLFYRSDVGSYNDSCKTMQKKEMSHIDQDMNMQDPMNISMRDMGMLLEGKTGDALNKAFLEGMIPHHQAAVDMAKYLAASDKPELVKLGGEIITAQTKEIEQMKQWMNEWGYVNSGTTLSGSEKAGSISTGGMMINPSMMNQ